jgi:orotidine-5'-phosphate decarboxylase
MSQLVVALDFPNANQAIQMVETLGSQVNFYKIGLELMMSGDYFLLLSYLEKKHKKIFADLKLYDIPQTVGKAVANLTKYNIDLLTIHAANAQIMQAASDAKKHIKIIAVTVLTCLDEIDLQTMGFDPQLNIEQLVLKKTKLALDCQIDGIVASVLEANLLKKNLQQNSSKNIYDNFAIVTPGIRQESSAKHDQKRTASIAEAVRCGSTHLVVGRPITSSNNPALVAQQFQQQIYETKAIVS